MTDGLGLTCITFQNRSIFSNLFNVATLEKPNMVAIKSKLQRKYFSISNKYHKVHKST